MRAVSCFFVKKQKDVTLSLDDLVKEAILKH